MALVVPDAAEEAFLDLILNVNYTLHLFTNDPTDGEDLDAGDFTEATFTGYEAKNLTGGSWTTTPGDPATGTYAVQAFVSSADQAPQTVYGYYVTTTSGGALRWYEKFDEPITVQYNGEAIRVTPQFTLADAED